MANNINDDSAQHGIDDDANNDAEKGAALGGLGGAAVGAAAGSLIGPVGTVVGAVVGGLSGAGASGLAVGAVDQVDNDNTVSGVGGGTTGDAGAMGDVNTSIGHNDIVGTVPSSIGTGSTSTNAVYPSDGKVGTPTTMSADVSDMNADRGLADTPNIRIGNSEADMETPHDVGPDGISDKSGSTSV